MLPALSAPRSQQRPLPPLSHTPPYHPPRQLTALVCRRHAHARGAAAPYTRPVLRIAGDRVACNFLQPVVWYCLSTLNVFQGRKAKGTRQAWRPTAPPWCVVP